MNITIVGGGNIGTQLAVHCAEKGHVVTIFSSKPESFQKELTIINEKNEMIHKGTISCATNDPAQAFTNADWILITYPAFEMEHVANIIRPFKKPGLKICIVPGTGGGECAFKDMIEDGVIVCGLQRVPSVARLVEYGKTVKAVGYRNQLHLASIPNQYANECRTFIQSILDKECVPLPNYLNCTLTPSNPILHTTRLYTLFKDYKEGDVYNHIPLFYEEWNDETSELLFQCDDELQEISHTLKDFDLAYVKSLKEHYESDTPQALTKKIRSIEGFKGLPTPSIQVEGGYIPDFHSRYFTADFPYGLAILVQIAELVDVDVSNMKKVWNWYRDMFPNQTYYSFKKYGITNIQDFKNFYSL